LIETELRIQAGKEEFIDWDEAKKSLRAGQCEQLYITKAKP
jgi:hypothetical protein